jgi:hypothetical protein
MRKNRSRLVQSLVAAVATLLALSLFAPVFPDTFPDTVALAKHPPPQRIRWRVRWRPPRSFYGLHATARLPYGPGPGDYDPRYGPYPCDGLLSLDGAEVWVLYPSSLRVLRDDPFVWPGIAVWSCGQEHDLTNTRFTLTGPDGISHDLTPVSLEDEETPYAHVYEFPSESAEGGYTLGIQSASGTFNQDFRLSAYVGPGIQVSEGDNEDVQVEYSGFGKGESLRVCLYRKTEIELRLAGGWAVVVNDEGYYIDKNWRPPADLKDGHYILVAVPGYVSSCLEKVELTAVVPPFLRQIIGYGEFELEPLEVSAEGESLDVYLNLQWVPGCYPAQPLALLRSGQGGCDPNAERRDLDWLAGELRELSLLESEEELVVVPLHWGRQALAIHSQAGKPSGWIRVGGGWPGSVWRTTYHPPGAQVGRRCWLGGDFSWLCE